MRHYAAALGALLLLAAFLVYSQGEKGEEQATDASQWGKPIGGFAIEASIADKKAPVCSPVWVAVKLKNVSDKPLNFAYINHEYDWEFEVRDSMGAKVPLTSYGHHRLDEEKIDHNVPMTLKPNEEFTGAVLINRLYDMTITDKYAIKVSRPIRVGNNPTKWDDIKVAPLTVEIVSPVEKDSDGTNEGGKEQ